MELSWSEPEFITVTCLEWKPLLEMERHREIVTQSMRFLSNAGRMRISAFVLMNNHFHLIWQMIGEHRRVDVQRDFLKYTSQMILRNLLATGSPLISDLRVNSRDRKFQVWERNSLSILLTKEKFLFQKLNYIHHNPVRAGLCENPEDYKYSSAAFYMLNKYEWEFIQHYKG